MPSQTGHSRVNSENKFSRTVFNTRHQRFNRDNRYQTVVNYRERLFDRVASAKRGLDEEEIRSWA